jgi:hypothetical protein
MECLYGDMDTIYCPVKHRTAGGLCETPVKMIKQVYDLR